MASDREAPSSIRAAMAFNRACSAPWLPSASRARPSDTSTPAWSSSDSSRHSPATVSWLSFFSKNVPS